MKKWVIIVIIAVLMLISFIVGFTFASRPSYKDTVGRELLGNDYNKLREQVDALESENEMLKGQVENLTGGDDEGNDGITVSVQKLEDRVIFGLAFNGILYSSRYWNTEGAEYSWRLYKSNDGVWDQIYPATKTCVTPCDLFCEGGAIGCPAVVPSLVCASESEDRIFEWDMTRTSYKYPDCVSDQYPSFICSFKEYSGTGLYKVAYFYRTDCEEGEVFGENYSIAEKEFTL